MRCLLWLFIGLGFSSSLSAQEAVRPRPSPLAMCKAQYKSTYIRILYSQPHKRGRSIFGNLVPYGEVWRTGANDATEITTTQKMLVAGKELRAGTYSLFTIPGEKTWIIIFNSDLGLWGSFNYNPQKDVLRVEVPVEQVHSPIYEPFTMSIDQTNERAIWRLMWDQVVVKVPLQFLL